MVAAPVGLGGLGRAHSGARHRATYHGHRVYTYTHAHVLTYTRAQALDLSYFSHPGGFPAGLLDAVAGLSRLTRLCLAGCGGLAADAPAGLGFLSGLRHLEELDLGAWQVGSGLRGLKRTAGEGRGQRDGGGVRGLETWRCRRERAVGCCRSCWRCKSMV